jgi:hypothetical protein
MRVQRGHGNQDGHIGRSTFDWRIEHSDQRRDCGTRRDVSDHIAVDGADS